MSTRRPGIESIVKEVRRKHPSWSGQQVNNEAKLIWAQRNKPIKDRNDHHQDR